MSKDGSPQVEVSGFSLRIFAGTAFGAKVHILMKCVDHSMTTTPPPWLLNPVPYEFAVVLVAEQPWY